MLSKPHKAAFIVALKKIAHSGENEYAKILSEWVEKANKLTEHQKPFKYDVWFADCLKSLQNPSAESWKIQGNEPFPKEGLEKLLKYFDIGPKELRKDIQKYLPTNTEVVFAGQQIQAFVGDGKFEKVTDENWGHLEPGNYLMSYRGVSKLPVDFLGWFDNTGKVLDINEEDPEKVILKFVDKSDSKNEFEFDVYHDSGNFCVGSSSDPIKLKAV